MFRIVQDLGPTKWGGFKRTAPVLGASAFGTGHFWLIRWLQSGCAHRIIWVNYNDLTATEAWNHG